MKKFKKLLALVLSLALLLSLVQMPVVISAEETSAQTITRDYYIAPGGTGDGRTLGTPAGSVMSVIQSINADGLVAGDTATVYVDGSTQPDYWNSSALNSKFIEFNSKYEHTATIVYTSLDVNKPAKMAFLAKFGSNGGLHSMFVHGPSVFKDIYLIDPQNSIEGSRSTYLNGNNVTFENVKFLEAYSGSSTSFAHSNSTASDNRTLGLGGYWHSRYYNESRPQPYGLGNGGRVKIDSSVLVSNSGVKHIVYGWTLTATPAVNPVYTEDTTLETNGGTLDKLYLTNATTSDNGLSKGCMIYNKNVNLVANNKTVINSFETNKQNISDEAVKKTATPVVKGAIQLVLNDGSSITNNKAFAYSSTDKTANAPVYILSSAEGAEGSLDVTDTAGVYKVTTQDGYGAFATDTSGKVYESVDGLLTVPAGEYTVTYKKAGNIQKSYYIAPKATGDGRTSETPAGSVETVINSINQDGLAAGDTATVYVDGSNQPNYWSSDDMNSEFVQFNSKYAHTATIVYTSLDVSKPAKIAFVADHGTSSGTASMFVTGPTVFKDIYLVDPQTSYESSRDVFANGNSVTFENVKFYEARDNTNGLASTNTTYDKRFLFTGGNWRSRWNADIPLYGIGNGGKIKLDPTALTVENGFKYVVYGWDFGGTPIATPLFTNDATIETNGGTLNGLYLTSCNGSNLSKGCMTYNKNVNLIANNKTVIKSFKTNYNTISNEDTAKKAAPIVKGAIQIVLNDGSKIETNSVSAYSSSDKTDNAPVYILSSAEGAEGSLDVTDTAGVYKVTTKDGYFAFATDSLGKVYESVDGYLTVPAGEYTVVYKKGKIQKSYYITPKATGDGRTSETPAGSVQTVINSINQDGLVAGDTATVYVDGSNQPNYWSSDDMNSEFVQFNGKYAHTATIVYTSLDVAKPAKIAFIADHGSSSGLASIFVTGPTVFKDIYLVDPQTSYESSRDVFANGNNVTFENAKFYEARDNTNGLASTNTTYDKRFLFTGGNWRSRWDDTVSLYGIGNGGKIKLDPTALTVENGFKYIVYGWSLSSTPIATPLFTEDATIETNGGTLNGLYLTHGSNLDKGCMTYNKNVNLVANNKTVIKSFKTNYNTISNEDTAKKAAPIVKGAIQIVLNDGSKIETNEVSAYSSTDKTANAPVYILSSAEGAGGSLDVTSVAGTFAVNSQNIAVATNTSTKEVYYSEDGLLTVPAGTYTVTYQLPRNTLTTVYVSSTGSDDNDGKTAETAVSSIAYAQTLLNSSESEGKKTIYLVDDTTLTNVEHTEVYTIKGCDSSVVLSLNGVALLGPTNFDNITFAGSLYTNGNIVDFGSNIKSPNYVYIYIAPKDDNVTTPDNVTFNGGFYMWATMLRLQSSNSSMVSNGLNLTINGGEFYQVYFGKQKVTYNGDVNIILNNATMTNSAIDFELSENNSVFNGALQVIINDGNGNKRVSELLENVKAKNGSWFMYDDTRESLGNVKPEFRKYLGCKLNTTDTAGTFKVENGSDLENVWAIATNLRNPGVIYYSDDNGYLTVPEGEWVITYTDTKPDFVSTGAEVVFNTTVEDFDLADITSTYMEGKVIIGWKNANGELVENGQTFNAGDKLYAVYADEYDMYKAFDLNPVGLRVDLEDGIRFTVDVNNGFYETIGATEQGFVVIPASYVAYKLAGDFYIGGEYNGKTPTVITSAKNLYTHTDGFVYSLCLTGISEENYDTDYLVRAFIKYTDLNGIERILYTDYRQQSVKSAVERMLNSEDTHANVKAYIEENYVPVIDAMKAALISKLETGAIDEGEYTLLSNGVRVREVFIGEDDGDTSNDIVLSQLTDIHINLLTDKDFINNRQTMIAYYRNRQDLRDGAKIPNAVNALAYADAISDQIVITGDTLDGLTFGGLESTVRIFRDKYPTVISTLGNHGNSEDASGMSTIKEMLDYDDILASYDNYSSHDVRYSSKLMNNKLLVIQMDNAESFYTADQCEKFAADLALAKEKGYKVVLFQHQPLDIDNFPDGTKNYTPDSEWAVKTWRSNTVKGLTASDTNNIGTIMSLLAQYNDVVEGIFCGHMHDAVDTTVQGVPQYISYANQLDGGYVVKITVR